MLEAQLHDFLKLEWGGSDCITVQKEKFLPSSLGIKLDLNFWALL